MRVETVAGSVPSSALHADLEVARAWSFRGRATAVLAIVFGLHVLGWGCALMFAGRDPAWLGIAGLAYILGLRHAFDADHIAAIDNVSRCMVGRGEQPAGVGLLFALGHSTVVAAASVVITVTAVHVGAAFVGAETARHATLVSMLVLLVVAPVNLHAAWQRYRALRGRTSDEVTPPARLHGLVGRLIDPLLRLRVRSGHIFMLGLAFGLGFETATSIALLGMSGAEADLQRWSAALVLPLVFAAGMTLVDSTEGLLMVRAYCWAADDARRRTAYQLGVALLSGVVALLVVAVQAIRLLPESSAGALSSLGAVIDAHFDHAGALIVVLFAALWLAAYAANRRSGCPERPACVRSEGEGS